MRLFLLALVAALSLTTLAAGQSDPAPPEKTKYLLVQETPAPVDTAGSEQERPDNADGVCYTLRSYIFERRGTEAPRLIGMVTCTRSSQRHFKRAQETPEPITPTLFHNNHTQR